ncbi:fimbrial protein [Herbaspirillum sp. YR522]|uniref:fimbrial protein n=1 Tax=Herbaspirillum sp. YR522 TaxID=1144342 RepID=UPI00026F4AF5|nr:fimbrial protein [Herbaspirillum sp. YR522]EJN02062.1 P pilus assembly protein, pilin FimA [Herbaspirillum sp. YR522]
MKSVLMCSLVAAMLSPSLVFAFDGTVNFTGSVVGTTCTYNNNGGTQNVALPPVSASALARKDDTAGERRFDIALSNCAADARNIAINLEGGQIDALTGYLQNSASGAKATNVAVQLVNPITATPLRLPAQSPVVAADGSGQAVIALIARYVATGPAAAGSGAVTSSVNFSIVYP